MSLFHPRVLSRITQRAPAAIPEHHAAILADWAATIESRAIYGQTEVALHAHFTQRILVEILGYEGFGNHEVWTLQHEQQIGGGTVDVALGHFTIDSTEIIAPFELKPARLDLDAVMPGRKKTPVQQAWEYAMDAAGARWVLVSNYLEVRLYAVGYGRAIYESWSLRDLTDPAEYTRFHTLLSAEHLLGGYTLRLLRESESVQDEITNELYQDYRDLRVRLFQQLREAHSEKSPRRILKLAQTILDRVLFIAFAEDTGLLPAQTLERTYAQSNPFAPVPIWHNFLGLFRAIDQGQVLEIDDARLDIPAYNGGLFHQEQEIADLQISDEICESFRAIGRYEFQSDVSVEVLGHILEQSITDLEELTAAANDEEFDARMSRRRTEGVYYTPNFVTRYIVENTIGRVLDEKKWELGFDALPQLTDADYESAKRVQRGRTKGQVRYNRNIAQHVEFWNAYKAALARIKVLDPACGSGAFLIAAFDYLLNEGTLINSELANLRAGQQELFRWDKHILQNNLFGVDLNSESIEITKLSLWLKTANPREQLTYLDDNIRVGNSVVDDRDLAPRDAFSWEEFGGGTFDVVVTNPPYVSMLELSRHIGKPAKEYWKRRFASATGAYDLYVLFMELAIQLVRDGGYVGLITPNKYLAVPYGAGIRTFIKETSYLFEVLNLSGDRVFQDPSVYPVVSLIRRTTDNQYPTYYAERDETTGRVERTRRIPAEALSALPDNMFSLVLTPFSELLLEVLQRCSRLEELAEVNATSTAKEADALSGYITEHQGNASPLVNTGTIDRFEALWGVSPLTDKGRTFIRPCIDLTTVKLSQHRRHVYDSQKIIFAKMALRPEAFLDREGYYCSINTNCVYDAAVPLPYLVGILNSRALAFIYDQFFNALRMSGGYLQFQSPQLRALPIPNADNALVVEICEQVEALHEEVEALLQIKRDFVGLLGDDFGIATSKKLGHFERLTWQQFAAKVENLGTELRGAAREDWHARFEMRSAEIRALQSAIEQQDSIIDGLAFRAYGFQDPNVDMVEELDVDESAAERQESATSLNGA